MKLGAEQGSSSSSRNNDPLLEAIKRDNIAEIKACLNSGCKPTDQHLNAVLSDDYHSIYTLLIEAGARINPRNCENISDYFSFVINAGQIHCVKTILSGDFRPSYQHLKMALIKEHYHIADLLLAQDVKMDNRDQYFLQNLLIDKIKQLDSTAVKCLLNAGAHLNCSRDLLAISKEGFESTCRHTAAIEYQKIYQALIKVGCQSVAPSPTVLDPKTIDRLLNIALVTRDYSSVYELIDNIISVAEINKNSKSLEYFLEDSGIPPANPLPPLQDYFWQLTRLAVKEGNINRIELFKSAGVFKHIDFSLLEKQAMVMQSIRNKDAMMLDLLLSIKPQEFWTTDPMIYECIDDPIILKTILNETNVLSYDVEPIEKVFFNALRNNDLKMIKKLFLSGADHLYTRFFKQDPLAYAQQYCNDHITKFLKAFGFKEHGDLQPANQTDLALFYKGITQASSQNSGNTLGKLISLDAKKAILARFIPHNASPGSSSSSNKNQSKIERSKQYCEQLFNIMQSSQCAARNIQCSIPLEFEVFDDIVPFLHILQPEEGFSVAKEKTGLTRTVTILRTTSTDFSLFFETKSKLATHTLKKPHKNYEEKRSGVYKRGKPNWRVVATNQGKIDLQETEYFHLIDDLRRSNNPSFDRDEARLSQTLCHLAGAQKDLFTPMLIGPLREQGQSLLSIKADGDLTRHNEIIKKLPQHEKIELAFELANALKIMHDNRYVFFDLHANNVLVYRSSDLKYHLKITDFGLARHYAPDTKIHGECLGDITKLGVLLEKYLDIPLDYVPTSDINHTLSILHQKKAACVLTQFNNVTLENKDDIPGEKKLAHEDKKAKIN